jgi:hypothetical protein
MGGYTLAKIRLIGLTHVNQVQLGKEVLPSRHALTFKAESGWSGGEGAGVKEEEKGRPFFHDRHSTELDQC